MLYMEKRFLMYKRELLTWYKTWTLFFRRAQHNWLNGELRAQTMKMEHTVYVFKKLSEEL